MIIPIVQLKKILSAGGSLVVEGSTYTFPQLRQIVAAAGGAVGSITIKGTAQLTPQQLKELSALAPSRIVFDLT